MAIPRFVQTTSTDKPLHVKGPHDMPDRGGKKPDFQTSSSQVSLDRKAHPVAAFGARPGQGEFQCVSSKVKLNRTANSPYEKMGMSATKPQVGFKGGKKK